MTCVVGLHGTAQWRSPKWRKAVSQVRAPVRYSSSSQSMFGMLLKRWMLLNKWTTDNIDQNSVGIFSGTAERNDCISFRILQEYDNLRNGTAERTVIGRNGTLILTLCLYYLTLTLILCLTITLTLTVIYAVQLPNVFRKLIVINIPPCSVDYCFFFLNI